ncbi:MAG TPA: histidine phosphatase family protein [Pyrinomonadaceae bacterium]|nr:histidine phosphatase family protein [Pyrinomonadaceae bacterium]
MKTIYLLRHAKSSWDNRNLADFERPLNESGVKTAPFMGEIIKKNNFQIDLILSSPAERAKQTARLVKEAGELKAEIRFDERIYEASPLRLLEIVSELDKNTKSAMLVGHNPGFEGLVRFLSGETQSMPTAALAVIDLDADSWQEIEPGCCNLRLLIRPKEEMKTVAQAKF